MFSWKTPAALIRRALFPQSPRRIASATPVLEVPIAIVGAGPTGLTLSLFLSRYGIPHVLLERAPGPTNHPQAHFINNRTMEVFRPLGGLAAEVTSLSPPLAEWRKFVYCESVSGGMLGEVDHFQGQDSPQRPELSPEPLAHLAQHRLLPLLLRRAAAATQTAQLLFNQEVTRVWQDGDAVYVTARGPQEQQQQQQGVAAAGIAACVTWKCRYLVAADGANSAVRAGLGVAMRGEPAMQHLINVHFTSKRMGQLALQRPAMLYFTFNADVVAVLVAHSIKDGEFVAQLPYFPPLQSPADFSEEVCKRLVRAAAGDDTIDVQIRQVRPWTMSAEVAERFGVGRVLLAGDAAHRFPPAGGFGMNTGVQDAHNLAWKLSAVLSGAAGGQLMDTYEAERRPVALANTALSVANWHEAVRVPSALGLYPQAANLLSTLTSALPLPASLSKGLLQGGLSFGRTLAAAPAAMRLWRRARLQEIFASGSSLRLQFPREDLGFRYDTRRSGAAVPLPADGSHSHQQPPGRPNAAALKNAPPSPSLRQTSEYQGNPSSSPSAAAKAADASQRGAPYVPSCNPGCRLPHVWLSEAAVAAATPAAAAAAAAAAAVSPASPLLSTLDVVSQCGSRLLLLVDGTSGGLLPGAGRNDLAVSPGVSWVQVAKQLLHLEAAAPQLAGVNGDVGRAASAQSPCFGGGGGGNWGVLHGHSSTAVAVVLPVSHQAQGTVASSEPGGGGESAAVRLLFDVQGRWRDVMQLPAGSALLVRPDGHVAWRHLGPPLAEGPHEGRASAGGLRLLQRAIADTLCT